METDRPDLDPRRRFTRKDVRRAWERQGRLCNLCQRSIPFDLMHGDHIAPRSKGGRTELTNLQALCGSCNLRKGVHPQEVAAEYFRVDRIQPGVAELREWQTNAMPLVLEKVLREPVLVEACPGAGKTHFALEVAYNLVNAGKVSRVLIVVPTRGIADGWRQASSAGSPSSPTLPLHGLDDWRPVNPIGDQWLGAITTYQSLFSNADMFLAHTTDPGHRTLVVFDEVHHAGVGAAWGRSAQEAFASGAAGILSLSGTPFRTDLEPIVFVPNEGGSAKPHFRYSYDDAIHDGACRPVQFVETRGETTFRTEDGKVHTVSFDESNLTDTGQRRRLRSALEWIEAGSIADTMLQDANQYLIELRRRGDSDAGGLVVTVDCDHADRVARHIDAAVTGHRPIVACSRTHDANDPSPANALKGFSQSHDPWIVAVNMVSEGIDIRRLRVVVYLTNRLTLLAFRQIVGRVVRTDAANVDDHGRVYIPADSQLVEMARRVTDGIDLLPPPIIIVTDPTRRGSVAVVRDGEPDRVGFETLGSVGELGNAFDTAGRQANRVLIDCARLFIEQQGLTNTDPESLALLASENPDLQAQLLALRHHRG